MANDATVHVTGNLIRDPKSTEVKGQFVTNFTIAANTTWKKKGSDEYITNFYNVEYWGQPAKWLIEKIQKGTMVEVTGAVALVPYENKDGQEGQSLNVKAWQVTPRARMKGGNSQERSNNDADETRPF